MSEAKNMTATEALAAKKAWMRDVAQPIVNDVLRILREIYHQR